MQKPWPGYIRKQLKPLTQVSLPRAAEWLRLARGGHLTYLHRHLFPNLSLQPLVARVGYRKQERASNQAMKEGNAFLAYHWMCTYIDALCAPTMDPHHLERIQWLCKVASWHWYKHLPPSMHTLLAHAMLHQAEQAEQYGPPSLYWLFHKERSA